MGKSVSAKRCVRTASKLGGPRRKMVVLARRSAREDVERY